MPEFKVIVSDEELKALEWDICNVKGWIQNAISEKARRTIDVLIEEHTDKNPKKMLTEDKRILIRGMLLETAKERNARIEQQTGGTKERKG